MGQLEFGITFTRLRYLLSSYNDNVVFQDPDESELNEVQASDITIPIPPGKWRMGIPCPKAKCILLRFSTRADKKQPQAEKMSEYYKKYGNPNYGGENIY